MKIRTLKLTLSEVNPASLAFTRGNSLKFGSVLGVIRPYLIIHCYKRKHKPQVRYKMVQFVRWQFARWQFARLQAINENTRDGKRTNFKELPRPHKLPQGAPAKSIKGKVKIGKTCLPSVGPPYIYKVVKEGQPH